MARFLNDNSTSFMLELARVSTMSSSTHRVFHPEIFEEDPSPAGVLSYVIASEAESFQTLLTRDSGIPSSPTQPNITQNDTEPRTEDSEDTSTTEDDAVHSFHWHPIATPPLSLVIPEEEQSIDSSHSPGSISDQSNDSV